MKNLKNFFEPKSVAVIGASRNPNKVGHVIFNNILDGGFQGEVIPVNPNAEDILGHTAYPSIGKLGEKVDLAIIAVPVGLVMKVVRECKNKGIKDVLIVTAGFSEIGNNKLEEKLKKYLDENNMRAIGVNCLGIYDAYNKLDTLFLPRYRLTRPNPGAIGFICQSGAVGSAVMDKATNEGNMFSKFISYGNATQVDESDLIEYLGNDEKTKVICLYVEGIKDGDKFYKTVKEVSKKKPIVALKGGLTDKGAEATISHTGSLAGKKEVYFGVLKQAGVIRAESLEEMFTVASLVEKDVKFKGNKLQVITNGGGYGIISTDNIVSSENIEMASISSGTMKKLKNAFPKTVNIRNPLDLVGDATDERYQIALEACISDKKIDSIFLIVLYQTPLITKGMVEIISDIKNKTDKPIIVVSTGGEFTENLSKTLEKKGLPVFDFPRDAVNAIDKLIWYENKRKSL